MIRETPAQVVMIGEFGTDVDEAAAAILACSLVRSRHMELLSFVGNHVHALQRARNAKLILTALGLGDVPVGKGEMGFGSTSQECENNPLFLSSRTKIELGREVLTRTLKSAEDNSVVLALNSGFTDAVWLWMNDPSLFLRKVKRVVIMGGVEMEGNRPRLNEEGYFMPSIGKGGAANNNFDRGSTRHLYHLVQEHRIPTIITTRFAAYGCTVPFEIFNEMSQTGNPIGEHLATIQKDRFRELWGKANALEGHPNRGDLPARCDRNWFITTFCGGTDPSDNDIADYIVEVAWYDPINLLAGVDALHEQFFNPYEITVNDTAHQVIGLSAVNDGIRNAAALRDFMRDSVLNALRAGQMPLSVF